MHRLLEQLNAARSDTAAVRWSYRDFRRAYPAVEIRAGIEFIGFEMLEAGDLAAARAEARRALQLDPNLKRAASLLRELGDG